MVYTEVNGCTDNYGDCPFNSACIVTTGGHECRCLPGFHDSNSTGCTGQSSGTVRLSVYLSVCHCVMLYRIRFDKAETGFAKSVKPVLKC